MVARAMWKGQLVVDERRVPVKLYAAVREERAHFRLLHRSDQQPVEQVMVDSESGEEVASGAIRRVGADADGRLIALSAEEIAAASVPASREIEMLSFVPFAAIDHALYDRAYYLGPDGNPSSYAAFTQALEHEQRCCLVRWVMRKRDYAGAVFARGGVLALTTLHTVERAPAWPVIRPAKPRTPSKQEQAMAHKLLEALSGPFDLSSFHDTYSERVVAMAEDKARGKPPALRPPRKVRESGASLEQSLRASLAALRKVG